MTVFPHFIRETTRYFIMNNFQHYYDLRQAGYDPMEVGSGFLRTIRSTLKGYAKRIAERGGDGTWESLKSSIQELYATLSTPHDMNTLMQEVEKHVNQLEQMHSQDRMQDGIRHNIIRMLRELNNHISDQARAN